MKTLFILIMLTVSAHAESPIESILADDAIRALRDPFRAPNVVLLAKEKTRSDLEMYALKEFKLNGVISGVKKPKAMVTLPNSKMFFISEGDKIGVREGHVVSIVGDSVKVVEYDHDESGKAVPELFLLSISGEIVSLTAKKEEL